MNPTDVNDDGNESTIDLLMLVNALPGRGCGRCELRRRPPSAGEGEGETPLGGEVLRRPEQRRHAQWLDLLTMVNEMTAEGEDPPIDRPLLVVPVMHGTNTPLSIDSGGGHYELRVMVQDTGVLNFMGDLAQCRTRSASHPAFLDMFWDRAQTDVQVNETQTIAWIALAEQQPRVHADLHRHRQHDPNHRPIAFSPTGKSPRQNIRNALVGLTKIGSSAVGGTAQYRGRSQPDQQPHVSRIRSINDEANKNFINLTGKSSPGRERGRGRSLENGGTAIQRCSPRSARCSAPRPVRDENFEIINDDVNDLLYYDQFFEHRAPLSDPQWTNAVHSAVRAGRSAISTSTRRRPARWTQVVELFRLRMTAKESVGDRRGAVYGRNTRKSAPASSSRCSACDRRRTLATRFRRQTSSTCRRHIMITEPVVAIDDAACAQ